MSTSISRSTLRADWRGIARRTLPIVIMILAGVLGVAAVAMAQTDSNGALRAEAFNNLPPLPGSNMPVTVRPQPQAPAAYGVGQGTGYGSAHGGAMPAGNGGGSLDQLMAWERQDMGVAPKHELHTGAFHGPTPNQIPGGQVITTKGLLPLLQQGVPVVILDVLGSPQGGLPNAVPLAWAAQPGSFNDQTQRQLAQALQQATQGRNDVPLVFYCGGPQCWMSYNAALRAIHLGYRNVLWYRGGVEAWQRASQQTMAAR